MPIKLTRIGANENIAARIVRYAAGVTERIEQLFPRPDQRLPTNGLALGDLAFGFADAALLAAAFYRFPDTVSLVAVGATRSHCGQRFNHHRRCRCTVVISCYVFAT